MGFSLMREALYTTEGPCVIQQVDTVFSLSDDLVGEPGSANVLDLHHSPDFKRKRRLEQLGIPDEEILRRLQSANRPRVRPAGDGILLVWKLPDENGRPIPILLISLPGILVIVRHDPIPAFESWLQEASRWSRPSGSSSVSLLISLLDHLLTLAVAEYMEARERVGEMIKRAITRPDKIDPGEVLELKEKFSAMTGQCETLTFLVSLTLLDDFWTSDLDSEQRAMAALESALHDFDSHLERQDNRLSDVLRRNELENQYTTTRRLNILTVLSAIFLPLTLIAGIYGMNFKEMPELQENWGYPMTLVTMVLIGGGMLTFFWRKGWLG